MHRQQPAGLPWAPAAGHHVLLFVAQRWHKGMWHRGIGTNCPWSSPHSVSAGGFASDSMVVAHPQSLTCLSLLTQMYGQQARALCLQCGAKLYTAQRHCLGPADSKGFSKEKQDRKDPVIPRKKHQHIPPDKQLRDKRQKRLPKADEERVDKYHVWKFQLQFCSAGYNHVGGVSQPCQEFGALLRRDACAVWVHCALCQTCASAQGCAPRLLLALLQSSGELTACCRAGGGSWGHHSISCRIQSSCHAGAVLLCRQLPVLLSPQLLHGTGQLVNTDCCRVWHKSGRCWGIAGVCWSKQLPATATAWE